MMIFANNQSRVGLFSILLPSMIVPFAGIATVGIQVFYTGLVLAPITPDAAATLLPDSVTLVLEFQADVVFALGAYVHGRSWLRPSSTKAGNRRKGYVRGLQQIGRLSLLAILLLVVSALYEAISLINLEVSWLIGWSPGDRSWTEHVLTPAKTPAPGGISLRGFSESPIRDSRHTGRQPPDLR